MESLRKYVKTKFEVDLLNREEYRLIASFDLEGKLSKVEYRLIDDGLTICTDYRLETILQRLDERVEKKFKDAHKCQCPNTHAHPTPCGNIAVIEMPHFASNQHLKLCGDCAKYVNTE